MGANGGRFPVVRSKVIKFDIAHNHVLFQEIQLRAGSTNSHRGCSTEGTEHSWFKNNLTHWNISRNFCELMNICIKVHLMQEFKTVLVLSVFCKNNIKKKKVNRDNLESLLFEWRTQSTPVQQSWASPKTAAEATSTLEWGPCCLALLRYHQEKKTI